MVLTPAATKVVTARVTEAPPFEPAHQALVNHLVKTFPVFLGNEDPDKHCGIKHNLRLRRKTQGKQRWRGHIDVLFSFLTKLHYGSKKSKILYPDLSNHPSSKVSKKKKDTGILGLITYCSSCRIHLIGSEIVQSISSCLMGVLRQVERMGPPLVCEYACV